MGYLNNEEMPGIMELKSCVLRALGRYAANGDFQPDMNRKNYGCRRCMCKTIAACVVNSTGRMTQKRKSRCSLSISFLLPSRRVQPPTVAPDPRRIFCKWVAAEYNTRLFFCADARVALITIDSLRTACRPDLWGL